MDVKSLEEEEYDHVEAVESPEWVPDWAKYTREVEEEYNQANIDYAAAGSLEEEDEYKQGDIDRAVAGRLDEEKVKNHKFNDTSTTRLMRV